MIKSRNAQIWVETVVYILIGLSIIALVVAAITPRIKQFDDKASVEEAISILNILSKDIKDTLVGTGNKRLVNIKIRKGELEIDSSNDAIRFILKGSNLKYSEPGVSIREGDIIILTQGQDKDYDISLTLDYGDSLNITHNDKEERKVFTAAPISYEISIENKGGEDNQIDLSSL